MTKEELMKQVDTMLIVYPVYNGGINSGAYRFVWFTQVTRTPLLYGGPGTLLVSCQS